MKTTLYIASKRLPETVFKLVTDETHLALVKRVRRQLAVGENVRLAA